jgi:hypothetical protein
MTLLFGIGTSVPKQNRHPDQNAPEFLALYQGTTSVVPSPAKVVRAFSPCQRKIRTKFQWALIQSMSRVDDYENFVAEPGDFLLERDAGVDFGLGRSTFK